MTSSISKKLEVGPGRIDATHIFPKKKRIDATQDRVFQGLL
jgi:hypothetical protein